MTEELFREDAVPRVGSKQGFDDGRFARLVHLGDEVVLALAGDLQVLDVQRGTIDDLAGAARRRDDDVQSWMHVC